MPRRRFVWLTAPLAVSAGLIGLAIVLLTRPQPCYACGAQTPPPVCGVNLSAATVKQGDDRRVWWNFLAPRQDRTLHIYLGLNNNQGTGSPGYTYQITYSGEWDPAVAGGITPTMGSGQLGPAGSSKANATIEISIPYSTTQQGDLTLTAVVESQDNQCIFRSPVTTTVRLNQSGPTVWPITPRTCPQAGAKPTLSFGIRNPGDTPATYQLAAFAENPLGGTSSDQFSLNGQGGEVALPAVTLKPGQTQEVKVSCETFGYCLTGGENRVGLRVSPSAAGDTSFDALAWSSVTIRDPNAGCPEIKDWWFLMPPALLGLLIGGPVTFSALGGAYYLRRRTPSAPPAPPRVPGNKKRPDPPPQPPAPRGRDVTHGRSRRK